MNDPNGLVRSAGRWHAFFQHHPDSDEWGPMHWGHASSVDGLHWEHHPIALRPDHLGTIFSGSVVIDADGTAGQGSGAWAACFTHHAGDVQHQSVAWSDDDGTTWTPHPGNPVIRGTVRDFRDPKVRRLADGQWHMVTTLGDRVACHRSRDLVHWEPAGTIVAAIDAAAGVWECPDLLPAADGSWWAVVSLSRGAPDGHSTTMAMPIEADDRALSVAAAGDVIHAGAPVRMDHGPDWYACQTFATDPRDGAVPIAAPATAMAWLNSWRYAALLPSAGWRGIQSLPRTLEVVDGTLRQGPAVRPEAGGITAAGRRGSGPAGCRWAEATGDVVVRIDGDHGSVTAGVRAGEAFVERTGLGVEGHDGRWSAPADGGGGHVVVVDHGSVEVFAAGGRVTLSAQVFVGAEPQVHVRKL